MKKLDLVSLAFLVVAVLLAGAFLLDPLRASQLGVEYWKLPSFLQQMAQEKERHQQLDGEAQQIMLRMEEKDQIVDDLLRGELTFWQAAARFHLCNLIGQRHFS